MGNFISKNSDIDDLNFIVSYYIFSLSWRNLNKLMSKKYCEKLISILTKVLSKYYEIRSIPAHSLAVLFTKIAHLFACILLNVNPVLVKDPSSNILFSSIKIPTNPNIDILPNCDIKSPILTYIRDQIKDLDLLYHSDSTNDEIKKQINNIYVSDLDLFNKSLGNENSLDTFTDSFDSFIHHAEKPIEINKLSMIGLYGSTIITFFQKNKETQLKLISYLDILFSLKDEKISINDSLNTEMLNTLNNEIRTLVLTQNIDCEEFIDTTNKIYEALVEQKIFEISSLEIELLLKEKDKLYAEIF